MKKEVIISPVILIAFSSRLSAQQCEKDLSENGPKTEYCMAFRQVFVNVINYLTVTG
jgi:hypothetical protein